MPLSVDIRANGRHVSTVHIARLAGLSLDGSVGTYSAVLKTEPWQESRIGDTEWAQGAVFEHTYGDGVEECVRRALNAVLDKSEGAV